MSLRSRKSTETALSEIQMSQLEPSGDNKPLLLHQSHSIKGWPTTPRQVKTSLMTVVSDLAIDIVLLVISIGFLAFAIAVRHYDQASTAENPKASRWLQNLANVGPSVFPILFAAVVGRAAHAILLWRLESGEHAGALDLLAGSTSLTSTVTSQVQLRMVHILGLGLLLLWALSPLGGQASIRQFSRGDGTHEEPAALTYMLPTGDTSAYDNTNRLSIPGIVNSIFLSALLAPPETKNSSVDLWNNVKLPMLEVYQKRTLSDPDGWYDTNTTQPMYASVIGVPVTGHQFRPNVDYHFNMDTSYLHLDCPIVESTSNISSGSVFKGTGALIYMNYNASCGNFDLTVVANDDCNPPRPKDNMDPEDYNKWTFADGFPPATPINFTYLDYTPLLMSGASQSLCKITTTYVEVEIACRTREPCQVTRIRRSRQHQPPPEFTVLHYAGGWSGGVRGNLGFFFYNFVNSMVGHPAYPTAVQGYLHHPDDPLEVYNVFASKDEGEPLLSQETYEVRMAQLVNAYWTCLTNFYTIPAQVMNVTFLGGTTTANSSSTTGTKITHFEIFVCNQGWSVLLIIASSILIAACLFNSIIRLRPKQGPNLMLNFSSLAMRDNPYVDIPDGGTALDAAERANLLKNVKVRFGDVDAQDEVGRLAIASIGSAENTIVGSVQKRRLYR